jgi:hypothetical protein
VIRICVYRKLLPDETTVGAVFLDGVTLTAKVLPGHERGMINTFNDPASFMVNGRRVVVTRQEDPVRWFEMQPTVWHGQRAVAFIAEPGTEGKWGIDKLVDLRP